MSSSVDKKTDFLRFNAYSIKELITRKLSEDGRFTDQIYEGSNLAILIDIVAYMYQCLMYQLNNAASESMFADTYLYENMNRLIRLIGYSPLGMTPSNITVNIQTLEGKTLNGVKIPKYSYIDTGIIDELGNNVCFSTVRREQDDDSEKIQNEQQHSIKMYNGIWKMYPTIFTADGTEYETFILDSIGSNSDKNEFVANDFIDVYVQSEDGSVQSWNFDKYDIFQVTNATNYQSNGYDEKPQFFKIYNEMDTIYNIRLNENKKYEIKFGNGTTGKRLTKGDKLYIFYLDTNGQYGDIDISEIKNKPEFKGGPNQFGISNQLYNKIVYGKDTVSEDDVTIFDKEYDVDYQVSIENSVVKSKKEEDVDTIRENAPDWFKTGNRLITKRDYEYFFKNCTNEGISDIKCMNNWEYMSKFYGWLYELGMSKHNQRNYYLNENFFVNHFGSNAHSFVDAADFNNIYLWIKHQNSEYDVSNIENNIPQTKYIKTLTSETEFLKAIDVYFDICAAPEDIALEYFNETTFGKDVFQNYESYIEITVDDDTPYIETPIKDGVIQYIKKYFDINNCKLGQNVDFNEITNSIYQISGIKNVRTIFNPQIKRYDENGDQIKPRIFNGLSFASWSRNFINIGDDLQISTAQRKLNDFQFPILNNSDELQYKIKVIRKSVNTINNINF